MQVDESQRENRSREHARFAFLLHCLTTPAKKRGDARALITKNILSGVLDTASLKNDHQFFFKYCISSNKRRGAYLKFWPNVGRWELDREGSLLSFLVGNQAYLSPLYGLHTELPPKRQQKQVFLVSLLVRKGWGEGEGGAYSGEGTYSRKYGIQTTVTTVIFRGFLSCSLMTNRKGVSYFSTHSPTD